MALDEQAVKAVIAFGLTDRYNWLDEDQPRDDGANRRPLPFNKAIQPKPALHAQYACRHKHPSGVSGSRSSDGTLAD